ncbi:NYN domain-containing protein [Kangiella sp. TOML190]|uniref:NYN domain-containing protein n=1 Tax=Kangiella sp. TOML190 TaxID=2931351 RepID=UPI00203F2831|nr:NYN domain-containing protein [Kangiella sp. TOML190]
MMTSKNKRIGIFVDVQNIYYTSRDAFGRPFNYRDFYQKIAQQGEIVLANAYAIHSNQDSQIKFQDALKHIGFEIKLKPFIQRSDGSAKGDWDVGITIDMLKAVMQKQVDRVILLSGDGDFELLLKTIRQDSKVISEVYAVESLTAQSLINAADYFYAIDPTLLIS